MQQVFKLFFKMMASFVRFMPLLAVAIITFRSCRNLTISTAGAFATKMTSSCLIQTLVARK